MGGSQASGSGGMRAVPRMLGRYHVIEPLGEDALGTQLLARLEGPNGFQRWAMLHCVHARLATDPLFVQAFYEGARLAARIHHPNVATTFDVSDGDEPPWVAVEYVHGEPVKDLLERTIAGGGSVPWDVACRVVAESALGIDAIAEQRSADTRAHGVILAPIAPSRLVMAYDGKAKVTEGCLPLASDAAALPYTAPERLRARGRHGQHAGVGDVRSDVFGLGVILWEAVAGRRLFVGTNKEDTEERIKANIVPPLRSLVTCPTKLDEVVRTALARDPEQRFPSARALARALETVIVSKGLVLTDDDVGTYLLGVFPDRFDERQKRLLAAANVTEVFRSEDVDRALSMSRQARAAASAYESPPPSSVPPPSTPPAPTLPLAEPSLALASFGSVSAQRAAPAIAGETFPLRGGPKLPATIAWDDTQVPADEAGTDEAPTVPRLTEDDLPPSSASPRFLPASLPPQSLPEPLPVLRTGVGMWRWVLVMAALGGLAAVGLWALRARPELAQEPDEVSATATAMATASAAVTAPAEPAPTPSATVAATATPSLPPVPDPIAVTAPAPPPPAQQVAPSPPTGPEPTPAVAPTALRAHGDRRPAAAAPPPPPPPPRRPPAPAPAAGEPARTGLLTVVCVPACDDVRDGRRSLGPSPVFKVALPSGPHKLTLRVSDPPTEKVVDVNIVPDETTAIRQQMND